jgi:hypothetical protein
VCVYVGGGGTDSSLHLLIYRHIYRISKGLLNLGEKRSLFSGLHIVLLVLLGDVGLHGVPRGAEPLAVGAAKPTGAQVLRFHVILLTIKMVSTQITRSKYLKTAKTFSEDPHAESSISEPVRILREHGYITICY